MKKTATELKEKPKQDSQKKETSKKKQPFWKRFKKSDRLTRDLRKMKKLNEKEARREKLRIQMFETVVKPKKKKVRKPYNLEALLVKAGVAINVQEFRKRLFAICVYISLALSLAIIGVAAYNSKTLVDIAIFMAGFWTAGFGLVLIIAGISVASYIDFQLYARRKQIETVLPDFLQLTAANIDAGMTIDRALWYAVRPRFGVLASEIEDVAKRVLTGEDLGHALRRFASQYDSAVLTRSINLLLEGVAAGGKIADLLHKIAVDIQEQQIMQKELAANVMTYVIFISFATIGGAPVLFGLSTQLLVVIKGIAAGIGDGASGSILSISPDVILVSDFQTFSIVVLICSSIVSTMIIGTIRKGSVMEALRYIPVFVGASLALYFGAVWFFGLLFGGLV